jgi:nicotinamide riboside kinase
MRKMREIQIIPWQHKLHSMCIGFSGSSNTGKTTLINAVNEYLKLPVVAEGFHEYVAERKLDPNHMLWEPKVRMKAQMDLLTMRKAIENSHTQFVADRTTIDMACITMAHLAHLPEYQRGVMDYTNECLIHSQQTYDVIFMLPHGLLPPEEGQLFAWQAQTQILTEHLTALGQPTFHVHQIQAQTIADRVAEVLEVVDQISTTKAKVHSQMNNKANPPPPTATQ